MNRGWDRSLWRPTATNTRIDVSAPPSPMMFEAIAKATNELAKLPYNPAIWNERAELLLKIGYPELAAGDARKAQKLYTSMLDGEGVGAVARKQIYQTRDLDWDLADLLRKQSSWDCEKGFVKQFHVDNFTTLTTALCEAGALYSFREICLEARAMYPADNIFSYGLASSTACLKQMSSDLGQPSVQIFNQTDSKVTLKYGDVSFRQYPFMPPEYTRRSAKLIASVNTKLLAIRAPCVLRASNFNSAPVSTPSPPSKTLGKWRSLQYFLGLPTDSETDNLGMFAISAIKKGDLIFKDPTTWGSSRISSNCLPIATCENFSGVITIWQKLAKVIHLSECCKTTYCSKECLETAKATYHQALCGKDFSWLNIPPQTKAVKSNTAINTATEGPMWLRILATCVQSDLHPLEHPSIAALTPNYGVTEIIGRRWSLASHIDVPQRILTTLGVDIFTDARYDTWVLQTIWARMINNQHGESENFLGGSVRSRAVNSLNSFINHSCEPNAHIDASYKTLAGSSNIAVVAKRDIEPGEEINFSYIGENWDRETRNMKLTNNWLSGDCQCTRCRREV